MRIYIYQARKPQHQIKQPRKRDLRKHGKKKKKATASERKFRREEIYMQSKSIIKHVRKEKEKYDKK